MIIAHIEVNERTDIKTIKGFYKSTREIGELLPNEYTVAVPTQDDAIDMVADWNASRELMKTPKRVDKPIRESDDWKPERISEEGKRLIEAAMTRGTDADWINLIHAHNQEGWSPDKYCCLSEKQFIKIKINRVKHDLGL